MSTINHEVRKHAELSGSTASRWLNCTQSVLLARECPRTPSSPAAKEGTRLHELTEKHLDEFFDYLRNGPTNGLKYDYTQLPEPLVVEVITHVYETILNKQLTQKYIKQEQKFYVSEEFNMFGMADLVIVHIDNRGKRCGIIVDYKFGHHEVEIKGNSQLPFYAVGLLRHIRSMGKDLDYVRTIIVQPKSDNPVKEAQYTADQLDKWEKKFTKVATDVYVHKKFKYKVGDWCGFCPAKAICKKYLKEMETKLEVSLVDMQTVTLPDPETIPIEQIENFCKHAKTLRDFLNKCEAMLSAKLRSGYVGQHLKLIQGTSKRTWIEEEEKVKAYLKSLGLEKVTTEKLINIGDVEGLLLPDVDSSIKTKKDRKAAVAKLLEPVTFKPPGGFNLVAIDDPRPAVVNAIEIFSDEVEDLEEELS